MLQRSLSLTSLTRKLSGLSAGTCGEKHATTDDNIMSDEKGDWRYLVIDPAGIRPRLNPTYSKTSKSNTNRYKEGTVVEIDQKRRAGWTTWLCLKSGGWLFDVSPKDKKVRMIEVEMSSGTWMYQACAVEPVSIMPFPSPTMKKNKNGSTLHAMEVVNVNLRARPVLGGKGCFLRLADGRGWVLDFADGKRTVQPWRPDGVNHQGAALAPETEETPMVHGGLGPSETGSWDYIVLDPQGMSLRSKPAYEKNSKIDRRVEEGEIVQVLERQQGEGTTFLKLACPQGWVFDRQPGKDSRLRMSEVNVEKGLWFYIVLAESGIALRARCSFSEATKCGQGPLQGALVPITQRVRVGGTTFLRLQDGGKWVFDSKNGSHLMRGPIDIIHPSCPAASVGNDRGITLMKAPTVQKWASTNTRVPHGCALQVKMLVDLANTRWACVHAGGMEGWTTCDNVALDSPCPDSSTSTPSTPFSRSAWSMSAKS